jgi:hypothetical protein
MTHILEIDRSLNGFPDKSSRFFSITGVVSNDSRHLGFADGMDVLRIS